ncbi:MAG: toxic anion resistance protein, partial [Pseudomonadota bacterium]|nr:toxic anion resistance protein [Pseudomonadota bacterium]
MSGFKPTSPFANQSNSTDSNGTPQAQPQTASQSNTQPITVADPMANPSAPALQSLNPSPLSVAQPTPQHQPPATAALTPQQPIQTDADIQRELAALQLPAHLSDQVRQMVNGLDLINNPNQLSELGRQSGQSIAQYSDHILKQVKQSDLDEMGGKLGEVVVQARSLNLSELTEQRSKIPLIGGFLNRMKNNKENFVLKFQSVDTHIQKIMQELSNGERSLSSRNQMLEQMFGHTLQEFEMLGVSIVTGKIKLAELEQLIQHKQLSSLNPSPQQAQEISDLKQLAVRLDKRVGDLNALQMSAMQTLPMIRMIQHNNQTLVEKFHNVRVLTLPAWKRQFMLAISLMEQKKAAELAQNIDDSTNEF